MSEPDFEWDETKNLQNQAKHGVSFDEAQHVFLDLRRIIARDISHSLDETRFYCFGENRERSGILTVRFTYRNGCIRIIGAGYWRRGRKIYERENSL